jgi:hypothetical protein
MVNSFNVHRGQVYIFHCSSSSGIWRRRGGHGVQEVESARPVAVVAADGPAFQTAAGHVVDRAGKLQAEERATVL